MGVRVFGIDGVPVFEMLFVVLVLLLMGLIVILLEIRKLRKLIKEEKTDVKRFEADLSEFEVAEGKKPTGKLVSYVQAAISKGVTEEQVESSLLKSGWDKEQIDAVFESLKRSFQYKKQKPQPKRQQIKPQIKGR